MTRRRPGPGQINEDDAELWHHVTRSVERVRLKPRAIGLPGRGEVHRGSSADPDACDAAHRHRPHTDRSGEQRPSGPHNMPQARAKPAPDLASFERKRARRLAGGRLEIDARIDLHGMRQTEAHHALVGFLRAAYHRGDRNVLVITGKGGPEDGHGDWGHGTRGVLKRNVPRWLAEPELRQIVVSFTAAAQRHGGDGALYVQLRARGHVG